MTGRVTGALAASLSCAANPAPAAADATEPRISWEIRSGDRTGDERFVCRSGGQEPCVLESTTDTRRTLALVGLHLHPVSSPVNYVGTVRAPFIDGITGLDEVSVQVAPGARPVNRTILGRVTRQPGSYTITLNIDAFVKGSNAPVRLQQDVPVTVR